MSLVFACIAPHGDVDLAPELREAMEELGRRSAAAAPDVAVVVSPHSVHVEGHFAVVTAGKVGEWQTEGALTAALLEAPLPILGVSYGGNDPATAEFPLDWGTEVPLGYVRPPRVERRSCRVETVRAGRIVCVAVVGTRDQRNPARQRRDRLTEPEVLLEWTVARRSDDDDARRPDELERHLGSPVERELRRSRVVAAERDAQNR